MYVVEKILVLTLIIRGDCIGSILLIPAQWCSEAAFQQTRSLPGYFLGIAVGQMNSLDTE
jgi:hypothetical protein